VPTYCNLCLPRSKAFVGQPLFIQPESTVRFRCAVSICCSGWSRRRPTSRYSFVPGMLRSSVAPAGVASSSSTYVCFSSKLESGQLALISSKLRSGLAVSVVGDAEVAGGFGVGQAGGFPFRMGFVVHFLHHVRMVQFESRSFGADPGQGGEVVPGRR